MSALEVNEICLLPSPAIVTFPLGTSRSKNLARKVFELDGRTTSSNGEQKHIRSPEVIRERTRVEDGARDIHGLELILDTRLLAKYPLRLAL